MARLLFSINRALQNGAAGLTANVRGALAIQFAFALPVVIGFTALGAEMTTLYVQQKRMQRAADAAVMSAGATGLTAAQKLAAARAIAAQNGFQHGQSGTSVTLNAPPTSGGNIATQQAQEVIITRPYTLHLARLFASSPVTVRARAVSIPGRQSTGCVLALAPTARGAITIGNSASVANLNCEIVSNSTNAASLVMGNNSLITGPVYLAGGIDPTNPISAQITGRPLVTNGSALADPYAGTVLPTAPTSCTNQTLNTGELRANITTVAAGRFCNGLIIPNNRSLTFSAGVYFIDGVLQFGNNVVMDATAGVTILLNTAPASSTTQSLSLGNGVIWRLNAPTTGATAGLGFVSRPSLTGTVSIANGASLVVEGAIYLPNMDISFSGNSRTSGARCTQLIARTISVLTSLSFQADCLSSNVKAIGRAQPILAE